MELGSNIRKRRGELGLSQDELASRIFVSRQTISSWENDRTYPDVQSLLLLARAFDVTVDTLIEGDMVVMEQRISKDARRLNALAVATVALAAGLVLITAWLCWQLADGWGWHAVPTAVFAAALLVGILYAAHQMERIKSRNDLIVYREVAAFLEGAPVDRDTPAGLKARAGRPWWRIARTIGYAVAGAVAGFAFTYGVMYLFDHIG